MTLHTIDPYNRRFQRFKNLSGSLISRGEVVEIDPTPSASATTAEKQTIDPFSETRGPFEGQTDVDAILYSIRQSPVAAVSVGDRTCLGISYQDIPDGEWGNVVVWGPCLAKVADTVAGTHLDAYGLDDTVAGQLVGVAPSAIETTAAPFVLAFHVGAGPTTVTGDLRNVFVLTGDTGGIMDTMCPFGTLISAA